MPARCQLALPPSLGRAAVGHLTLYEREPTSRVAGNGGVSPTGEGPADIGPTFTSSRSRRTPTACPDHRVAATFLTVSSARAFLTWALLSCALSSSPCGSLEQASEHGVSPVSVPSASVRTGEEQIHRHGSRLDVHDGLDDLPSGALLGRGPLGLGDRMVGHPVRSRPAPPAARTILTYRANAPPEVNLT